MKINYPKILKKNMINVLRDVLIEIEKNGLKEGHHLYIVFQTKYKNINLPAWLKKKFPEEITIVIQNEYWNLKVFKDKFEILLSFNDSKVNLSIPFNSIISFADPYANFGLKLKDTKDRKVTKENIKKKTKKIIESNENVIDFSNYKKSS